MCRKIQAYLLTLTMVVSLLFQFTLPVSAADKTIDLSSLVSNLTINTTYLTSNSIGATDKIILTGSTTSYRVIVQTTCNIMLSDASITSSGYSPIEISTSGAALNLTLSGTNTLVSGQTSNEGYPGIYVNSGTTLNIGGTGSLTVIAATGSSKSSAGIGSRAYQNPGGTIHISGGTIYATGGGGGSSYGGAGIGSGDNSYIGTLTIDGTANIIATGGAASAGIGEGSNSYGGVININGGTIVATGNGGAGIGNGSGSRPVQNGTMTDITIGGGVVTASSINGGAGIGSGASSSKASWIHISGGIVDATGSVNGISGSAGIGGGYATSLTTPEDANGRIIIDGTAVVTARGAAGSYLGGAGVGCSYQSHSNMPITIGGTANVTAYAGGNTSTSNKAAAIGGVGSAPVTISIASTASIKAIANYTAVSNNSGSASIMQVSLKTFNNANIVTAFTGSGATKTLTAPFQYYSVAMTVPTGEYVVRNNDVLQVYSDNNSNKVFSISSTGLNSFSSVRDVTTPTTMLQLNFASMIAANTVITVCDSGGNTVATKTPSYDFSSVVFSGIGTGPYTIKCGSDVLMDDADHSTFTLSSNMMNIVNGVTRTGITANLNSAVIKGVTVSSIETGVSTIANVTAGNLHLSGTQAASNYTSVYENSPASTIKVVKYAIGSTLNETTFDLATAYSDTDAINNGDFFIIRVKSADATVTNYYKIVAAIVSDDATLSSATIKGVSAILGTSASAIGSISSAGSITLTDAQAGGSGSNTFTPSNANAAVKVVKYTSGGSIANFATDIAYTNTEITTGDFFIIKVTAQDNSTVAYYKIILIREDPSNEVTVFPHKDKRAEVIVNGKIENMGTIATKVVSGLTTTVIALDEGKLYEKLAKESKHVTITIPVNENSDVVIGELSGLTVKNMEQKEAVLEIKTSYATYKLPALEINIDQVSKKLGLQADLKDLKVDVSITQSNSETVNIVQGTADRYNYQVLVKPIDFEITCSTGGKTEKVTDFSSFVERTIAIPDGIDPSKITTGILLNDDGTFSHVPTVITIFDGRYYAKINSLTNSTYSVIYNPTTFLDVENHWSKDAVNDMASRLVLAGIGDEKFAPDSDISRAEFAAIIVRGLGLGQDSGERIFSDVKNSDWFDGYVRTAVDYNLIKGYNDGTFKPNNKITREEAMVVFVRAMQLTGLKTDYSKEEIRSSLASMKDSNTISAWAKEETGINLINKLVTGRNGIEVAPKSNITRAEVATITQRLLKNSDLIN